MITLLNLVKTYWIPLTLFVFVSITVLSLIPIPKFPDVPGNDKTLHFIAYGVLMFPAALRKHKYWLFIGVFFICWSGMLEIVQPYINRYGEWMDMLANTTGVICSVLLAQLINWIFHVRGKDGE